MKLVAGVLEGEGISIQIDNTQNSAIPVKCIGGTALIRHDIAAALRGQRIVATLAIAPIKINGEVEQRTTGEMCKDGAPIEFQ